VERRDQLSPDTVAEVLALTAAATAADGVAPVNEEVVLRLRHDGDPTAVHLLTRDPQGTLVGYARLDSTDQATGPVAELVVHPAARRRGLGRELVTATLAAAAERDPHARLRIWAHGDHPAAARLADAAGLRRTRVLHQLRRPLTDPLDAPRLPAGVVLRAFRPGEDDQAWLALNTRAFADHPEQGRWGEPELRLRMAEPWFDPAGFLLAQRERDGALVGFHWTKVHGPGNEHHHWPIGEVYVLGVDPAAHGTGLGTALTLAGLEYLRDRGLDHAMLYVDESNRGAMALYEKLGFTRWRADVTYARTGPAA
jgi:mycothiol synthase